MSTLSQQYHSLIISGQNTWDNWHIVPTERPSVAPAAVKESYVDIPGANGTLDYTEALAGTVLYGDSEGSWEFIVLNGYQEWYTLYNYLLQYLHGKEHTIILEDEPDYQYTGRLKVNQWKSEQHNSKITIDYKLSPYRTLVTGNVSDWKWDDLTVDSDTYVIYYGRLDLDGYQIRNLYSLNDEETELSLTLTSPMTVSLYRDPNVTFDLPMGLTEHIGIFLRKGENLVTFNGTGRVTVNYDKGVIM